MSLIRARYRAVNTIMNLPRGGGYVGLLDLYPNAAAAYSLRKLRAAYSGAAVRVRKEVSLVSSETDIGFLADGSLDTVSLLAFASDADSGDVFVVTWYDQSLSNNATQSLAVSQPKIVSSGTLVEENGKAAVDFDGVNDILIKANPTLGNAITNFTAFTVAKYDATGLAASALYGASNNVNYGTTNSWVIARQLSGNDTFVSNNNGGFFSNASAGASTLNQTLFYHQYIASTEVAIGRNGGVLAKNTTGIPANLDLSLKLEIGALTNPAIINPMNGKIQEIFMYEANKLSDRAAIETNINTFYSIYP